MWRASIQLLLVAVFGGLNAENRAHGTEISSGNSSSRVELHSAAADLRHSGHLEVLAGRAANIRVRIESRANEPCISDDSRVTLRTSHGAWTKSAAFGETVAPVFQEAKPGETAALDVISACPIDIFVSDEAQTVLTLSQTGDGLAQTLDTVTIIVVDFVDQFGPTNGIMTDKRIFLRGGTPLGSYPRELACLNGGSAPCVVAACTHQPGDPGRIFTGEVQVMMASDRKLFFPSEIYPGPIPPETSVRTELGQFVALKEDPGRSRGWSGTGIALDPFAGRMIVARSSGPGSFAMAGMIDCSDARIGVIWEAVPAHVQAADPSGSLNIFSP